MVVLEGVLVVLEAVLVEKLPFEPGFDPRMVTTVQKSDISETIQPPRRPTMLPKALETFREEVSTFPGRYRSSPEALTMFRRGLERFPGG
jgi:hypothetical protein